jgi:hypothetical protein
MAKKRETTTSVPGPGIAEADDGMPEVRGNDPATSQSDLSGISGLPGVQPSNPDRKHQEVSAKPTTVAKRTLKLAARESSEMTLDEKIGALNAFRKIRSKSPRVSDHKIGDLIRVLYEAWVDDMMLRILQPKNPEAAGFTEQETQALKVLAQTILQRQTIPGQPAVAPVPSAQSTQPVSRQNENPYPNNAAPMIPRNGLNPGVNANAYRDAQSRFLEELAKLDREDPESKWRNQ